MTTAEVKKRFPRCIIVSSNYELYELILYKMFEIIKRWIPNVEQYSVDEWFVDITGFRRVYNCSYEEIAGCIKQELEVSLHVSVSVGVSINKSPAKLASDFNKLSGLVVVPDRSNRDFLRKIMIEDIWGVGPNTTNLLHKHTITTAYDLAVKPERFIQSILSKPKYEIWRELRGDYIFTLNPLLKTSQKSSSKTRTFIPTTDREFLWGQLAHNFETVCRKARTFNLVSAKIGIYLKGQDFRLYDVDI